VSHDAPHRGIHGAPSAAAALLLAAAALAGCGHARRGDEIADGRRIFVTAGCGSCHTVASARTHGTVGPNFDTSEALSREQIRAQLDQGEGGMPSFRHRLTAQQTQALTEFVYRAMRR
jgi:mono/diheme cytochrome c family protein